MVGRQGEAFSSRVLHFASSLRGTKQYWQRQRSRLLSMVDTLGLPTVFFTHSAADLQWPELARLICPNNPDSRTARTKAVIDNPALSDWFFYHRVMEFLKAFYTGVLGATDYWLRFEWQHRGSPHVHGLAWLPDTPDVEQLLHGAASRKISSSRLTSCLLPPHQARQAGVSLRIPQTPAAQHSHHHRGRANSHHSSE